DRLVLGSRCLKGLVVPFAPLDRLVRSASQVGTAGSRQSVGALGIIHDHSSASSPQSLPSALRISRLPAWNAAGRKRPCGTSFTLLGATADLLLPSGPVTAQKAGFLRWAHRPAACGRHSPPRFHDRRRSEPHPTSSTDR